MFNWVYHGKNKKQCYYRANCLVCYAKLFLHLIKLSIELRKELKKGESKT